MDDAERWEALGRALEALVAETRSRAVDAWRQAARDVLVGGGLAEDDPVLARLAAVTPVVDDIAFETFGRGPVGSTCHAAAEEARIAARILRIYRAADDPEDDPEGALSWLHESVMSERPELPDGAFDELPAFVERARNATFALDDLFPLEPTGHTERDLVEVALGEVAERAGIPRESLPRPSLADRPALAWISETQAFPDVYEWLFARVAWARVLARLGPLLSA